MEDGRRRKTSKSISNQSIQAVNSGNTSRSHRFPDSSAAVISGLKIKMKKASEAHKKKQTKI